jgi:hypothetical protein
MANLTLVPIKQGDLEPLIAVTLQYSDGTPVVLSGATVQFRFSTYTRTELFVRDAIIDDINTGDVSYAWQAGDTDLAGVFLAEFVVDWPSDRPQTYPNSGYLIQVIEPKL